MKKTNRSGQVGLIVILVCLVIIGFLVWRNYEAVSQSSSGVSTPAEGQNVIRHFEGQVQKIEEEQSKDGSHPENAP